MTKRFISLKTALSTSKQIINTLLSYHFASFLAMNYWAMTQPTKQDSVNKTIWSLHNLDIHLVLPIKTCNKTLDG